MIASTNWVIVVNVEMVFNVMVLSACTQNQNQKDRPYLFDPHKKFIQSNNEKHLGSGDPY